jgi:hypothetical protein
VDLCVRLGPEKGCKWLVWEVSCVCVHTTNTRSGTEADDDDDAPRQIDQSKFCILYSVKILSQHYQKPQININFLLRTAQDTENDLEI